MKKTSFALGLVLIVLCIAAVPAASPGTKTLGFAWEQPAADTAKADFGGWKLYRQNGEAWELVATIPYGGTQQTTYTVQQALQAPDGAETTMIFTLTAFDKSGNESARSNTATAVIDFLAPGVPFNLIIKIVSQ